MGKKVEDLAKFEHYEESFYRFLSWCVPFLWLAALIASLILGWFWLTGLSLFFLIVFLAKVAYQRFRLKYSWRKIFGKE